MPMTALRAVCLLPPLLSCTTALAAERSLGIFDSQRGRIELVAVVEDLKTPWAVDFLPDGRMLINERPGRMQLYDATSGRLVRLGGLPAIAEGGQGGLLDVVVHPGYADNGWIYFSYSMPSRRERTTAVARARLDGDRLIDRETLFTARPYQTTEHHYGSRLVLQEGYLFISVGDRGQRREAQRLGSHLGKVIRLHDDGRVPQDNPFVETRGAEPEIWSYGHRNPQGLALHPQTGELWEHEHGPQGGDEINRIRRGANYGWPIITYGREYSGGSIGEGTARPGLEQPVKYYVPSIGPSGMSFYSGDRFPGWRGNLFVGALALTHLNRLELRDAAIVAEERLFDDLDYTVRCVREGPDGLIYLCVDAGMIVRLQPAN